VRGDRPQQSAPNREHDDEKASTGRGAEELPSFLAKRGFGRDDHVGAPKDCFHFRCIHSVPGDVANVVDVPIEALAPV